MAQSGDTERTLASFAQPVPESRILAQRGEIDRCFARASLFDIVAALNEVDAPWAREAEAAIATASPTSLAITFRVIREAPGKSLRDCLTTDFRVAQRLMHQDGYFEGARAILIDKDRQPKWRPATLAEVDPRRIDEYFAPLGAREMTFA